MTNSSITRLSPLGEEADWLLAESRSRDVRGNETVQTVTQNPATYERTTTVSNATSVLPAISLSLAGLTTSSTDQHGCTTTYGYDALMRQISAESRSGPSNERLNGNYTHYNVIGQVEYTEDAFGTRTTYVYDSVGRKVAQTFLSAIGSLSNSTYTAYDSANRPLATWGATYPVAYEYDNAGRMTAMYTYRGTNEINSYSQITNLKSEMDRTSWLYDEATGLLTNKLYADGKGPSYTYTALGQLSTRAWARLDGTGLQLQTLYSYNAFSSLTNTAYSDGTPSVSFTYDSMGRQKVAQTFLSASGAIISSTTNIYSGLDLIAEIQNGVRIDRQVDSFGRPKGLAIGQGYAVKYGFDEYGRFKSVQSFQSVATNIFTYSYLPGSHLISGYTATQPVSSFEFQVSKSYEPNRDLITTVSNTFGTATISAFGYLNDAFGRRTARVDTTPTLTVNNAFGYNLKSEVTSATMANGDSSYEYDPIGNRVFSSLNALTNTYSANALNQYAVITNSVASVPPCLISPSYDYDGNLTTNGVWSYSWDAENRLTAVYSNNTLLVSNVYDHQSRRIAKIVSHGGTETQRRVFVYDDWNVISEKLFTSNFSLSTFYTWGLDISGTLQGAGGVGGLLAVNRDNSVYFPFFDANGNVTEYIDATGAIRAHYAFDAFGNTISQSGDLASTFSHRFSTKYFDAETGLYYYGYRYYSSELGRWLSRDPIEEEGGVNVYGLLSNDSVNNFDFLGLKIEYKRDKTQEQVEVNVDCNESIDSIAKHFGFESDSDNAWLEVADDKDLPASNDEKFTEKRKFKLPNVILFTYGNMTSHIGTRGVMSFLKSRREVVKEHYEKEGFYLKDADLAIEEENMMHFEAFEALQDTHVHGWSHFGHGKGGTINFVDVAAPTAGFDYTSSAFKPIYKLAEVVLYSCEAGQGNWKTDVVSKNGKLYASKVLFYPPITFPGRKPWYWKLQLM